MTPKQLAKFLQVSPSTVARLVGEGLPRIKVAGQSRFMPVDVLAHLKKPSS